MRNHSSYFVLPSSCTLSQLISEISKKITGLGLGLGLFLVSIQYSPICVHACTNVAHILFFMCPNEKCLDLGSGSRIQDLDQPETSELDEVSGLQTCTCIRAFTLLPRDA